MIDVDNPLKWLLAELPAYLTPAHLPVLLARYETQKRRYYHAVKLRDLERKIKSAERWPPSGDRTAHMERWRARLAKMKEEPPE